VESHEKNTPNLRLVIFYMFVPDETDAKYIFQEAIQNNQVTYQLDFHKAKFNS